MNSSSSLLALTDYPISLNYCCVSEFSYNLSHHQYMRAILCLRLQPFLKTVLLTDLKVRYLIDDVIRLITFNLHDFAD